MGYYKRGSRLEKGWGTLFKRVISEWSVFMATEYSRIVFPAWQRIAPLPEVPKLEGLRVISGREGVVNLWFSVCMCR